MNIRLNLKDGFICTDCGSQLPSGREVSTHVCPGVTNVVWLVFRNTLHNSHTAGAFSSRELAEAFVASRKTPRAFSIRALEVFTTLDGCKKFH